MRMCGEKAVEATAKQRFLGQKKKGKTQMKDDSLLGSLVRSPHQGPASTGRSGPWNPSRARRPTPKGNTRKRQGVFGVTGWSGPVLKTWCRVPVATGWRGRVRITRVGPQRRARPGGWSWRMKTRIPGPRAGKLPRRPSLPAGRALHWGLRLSVRERARGVNGRRQGTSDSPGGGRGGNRPSERAPGHPRGSCPNCPHDIRAAFILSLPC